MEPNIIKYIKKLNNKPSVQRRLLEYFIAQGASTIPEMSKGIGVSLPTATNALNELIKGGLVKEARKTTPRGASQWFTTLCLMPDTSLE